MISFALCMPLLFLIFLKKIGESLGNPIPLPIIVGKKENKKRGKYEMRVSFYEYNEHIIFYFISENGLNLKFRWSVFQEAYIIWQ